MGLFLAVAAGALFASDLPIQAINATSPLPDNPDAAPLANQMVIRYAADKAFDGDPLSVRAEGEPGTGTGQILSIEFSAFELRRKETVIDEIIVMPGYFDIRYFKKNNRVRRLRIDFFGFDGKTKTVLFEFLFADGMIPRTVKLEEPVALKSKIEFTILDVYRGDQWDDTCISEISLLSRGIAYNLFYPRI